MAQDLLQEVHEAPLNMLTKHPLAYPNLMQFVYGKLREHGEYTVLVQEPEMESDIYQGVRRLCQSFTLKFNNGAHEQAKTCSRWIESVLQHPQCPLRQRIVMLMDLEPQRPSLFVSVFVPV